MAAVAILDAEVFEKVDEEWEAGSVLGVPVPDLKHEVVDDVGAETRLGAAVALTEQWDHVVIGDACSSSHKAIGQHQYKHITSSSYNTVILSKIYSQ